jgi:transposase
MRLRATDAQLEKRRRRAIHAWKGNKSLAAVARRLGAAKSSVWRWVPTYKQHGLKGLRSRRSPGRPSYLGRREKEQLATLLLQGARAVGYRTELWTLERIAKVLWRQFRVRSHPHAIWHLLRGMGWSCQKPQRRAQQRDEATIAHWQRYVWPQIKKGRPTWSPSGVPG